MPRSRGTNRGDLAIAGPLREGRRIQAPAENLCSGEERTSERHFAGSPRRLAAAAAALAGSTTKRGASVAAAWSTAAASLADAHSGLGN